MLFVSQGNLPRSRKNQARYQNPVWLCRLIILTLALLLALGATPTVVFAQEDEPEGGNFASRRSPARLLAGRHGPPTWPVYDQWKRREGLLP